MASKLLPFVIPKRFPIRVHSVCRFSLLTTAAHVRSVLETASDGGGPADFDSDSAVHSLRNNPRIDRLTCASDSTTDTESASCLFKWASTQTKFRLGVEVYAEMALRVGLAGHLKEMEDYLAEMVKLDHPGVEEALSFLLTSFLENGKVAESVRVFKVASSFNCRPQISTCNALMRALVAERWNIELVVFVYKEMVKGGVIPDVVTVNCLIEALIEVGRVDTAVEQFHRIKRRGCLPNSRTFEVWETAGRD